MLARFHRALYYWRTGTFFDALRAKVIEYRHLRRRSLWLSQRAKEEFMVETLHPGIRLRLYFDDELSWLIYGEDFEWQERQFLCRFLKRGDVFVDVGANIGLFTLIAAFCVGPDGCVHSFEPCARTFQRLLANVRMNDFSSVSCSQMALSDTSGTSSMFASLGGHAAWNSLASIASDETFAAETVRCAVWDDYARENQLIGRIAMMKIDVEGWEAHVLRGASETLSRPDAPVLQVEFTDRASEAVDFSCAQLYGMLEELGYQMYVYDGQRKQLTPDPLRESYPYVNLIAAKRIEEVMARLDR
jgi:FkbM family methyltransferase